MGDSGQAFWVSLVAHFNCVHILIVLVTLAVSFRYNKLRDKFPPTSFSGRPTLSEAGFDLLNKLLTFDPEKVFPGKMKNYFVYFCWCACWLC